MHAVFVMHDVCILDSKMRQLSAFDMWQTISELYVVLYTFVTSIAAS